MDIAKKNYLIKVYVLAISLFNVASAHDLPQSNPNHVNNSIKTNTGQELADSESLNTTSGNQQEKTDTIGEEPPEDISRLFLRESEILLKPMEVQLTTGFIYRKDDTFEGTRLIRNRDVSIPISVSLGISDRFEIFASVPLLSSRQEYVYAAISDKIDDEGYGDVSFGFSFKLRNETQSLPSITGSVSQSSPTGSKANPDESGAIDFTSGILRHIVGLNISKSVDPAVLFINFGYSYVHTEEGNNPGNSFNYGFGAGFSINSAISISGRLLGSYTKDEMIDGESIVGSGEEAVSFDLGLTYGLSNKTRMATSVEFGLNDDASDVAIGLTLIYSLRKPGP